jgi:hypothetical protein
VRVVVISPYPPTVDARGDVALEIVRDLRRARVDVDVVSPEPSAARHHAPPGTWRSTVRLLRLVRGADRVVIVGDASFLTGRAATSRFLARAFSRLAVDVVPGPPTAWPPPGPVEESIAGRMERLRSGAPTFVRTVVRGRSRRPD